MADDLVAAVAAAKSETGFDKPILCGLCSGGNVVVGTLKRIPQAKALLLMSVYPFSDGDAFGRDIHRTFHYLSVYWQKLWRGDTWSRFFKGDVSLKSVCNVIFGHLLKRGANKKKEEGAAAQTTEDGKNKLPKAAKAAAVESRSQGKEPPKSIWRISALICPASCFTVWPIQTQPPPSNISATTSTKTNCPSRCTPSKGRTTTSPPSNGGAPSKGTCSPSSQRFHKQTARRRSVGPAVHFKASSISLFFRC
ncbi:MAG: hypothetical protein IKZ84_03245, partial [Victivallales bacterium]|nr:hypothetical protein [Victivallales bacterium]